MTKAIIFFLLIWVFITTSIYGFTNLVGEDKLSFLKAIVYGALTASITLGLIILIVVIF